MNAAGSGYGAHRAPDNDFAHCAPARNAGNEKTHERPETGPEKRVKNRPVARESAAHPGVGPENHTGIIAKPLAEAIGENIEKLHGGAANKAVKSQEKRKANIEVAQPFDAFVKALVNGIAGQKAAHGKYDALGYKIRLCSCNALQGIGHGWQ